MTAKSATWGVATMVVGAPLAGLSDELINNSPPPVRRARHQDQEQKILFRSLGNIDVSA
jgi:hypothetical protein